MSFNSIVVEACSECGTIDAFDSFDYQHRCAVCGTLSLDDSLFEEDPTGYYQNDFVDNLA